MHKEEIWQMLLTPIDYRLSGCMNQRANLLKHIYLKENSVFFDDAILETHSVIAKSLYL